MRNTFGVLVGLMMIGAPAAHAAETVTPFGKWIGKSGRSTCMVELRLSPKNDIGFGHANSSIYHAEISYLGRDGQWDLKSDFVISFIGPETEERVTRFIAERLDKRTRNGVTSYKFDYEGRDSDMNLIYAGVELTFNDELTLTSAKVTRETGIIPSTKKCEGLRKSE